MVDLNTIYKWYQPTTLRVIADGVYPKDIHSVIENETYGIYFIDFNDNDLIYKTDDEGLTVSLVETRLNIDAAISNWHDRANNKIYFLERDSAHDLNIFNIDLTTDIPTEMGKPNAAKNLVETGDIFMVGANIYVLAYYYNVTPNPDEHYIEIYRYTAPGWNLDGSQLIIATNTGGLMNTTAVVVVGNLIYFLVNDVGSNEGELWSYNVVTTVFTKLKECTGYTVIPAIVGIGIAYEGTDLLFFTLNKNADSLIYYCSYEISTNTFTEIMQNAVGVMMDRNCDSINNPIPFNLEHAFDLSPDADGKNKIYGISKTRTNFLALAKINNPNYIGAVTDHYIFAFDGTIYKWENYITALGSESVIRARQKSYWTCDLFINMKELDEDVELFDGMYTQILGNLTSNTNTGLISYYGSPDNFLDEEAGAITVAGDMDFIDTLYIPDDCSCELLSSFDNHHNVLALSMGTGTANPYIIHNFPEGLEPSGTREFWVGTSDNTKETAYYFLETSPARILFKIDSGTFWYDNGGWVDTTIAATNNTLFHIKIVFNCVPDTYNLYINNVLIVTGAAFNVVAAGIDKFYMKLADDAEYTSYLSAWGDPADNNYYEGQNQVKTKEDQVIFEGYLHFSDLKNPRKCWIDSPSLFDLKKKLTAGTYGAARTDQNIVSILAVDSNYIVEGTMSNGTAAITTIIKGSKALQTQLNSYGQLDGFTYSIKPDQGQGLLMYNDGTVSSGVRCSQDEKIKYVQGKKQRAIINQVTIKGAINTATGVPYTGTYDDEASQRLYGVQPISRTFANLYSDAACLAQATAILTIQQEVPYTYDFAKKIGWEGLVLPSETITLEYTPDSMITSGTRIINALEFYFRAGICKWEVQDAISYTTEMDLLKQEVEENSDLIEQLAADVTTKLTTTGLITEFTNRRLYFVSTDAELDAAITAIETGNYSAKIIVTADLTNVQATINDANVDIEIDGQGHMLDANGDNTILTITTVNRFILRNIIFDATDITSNNKPIILISAATKPSLIEHCEIYEVTATRIGYGIQNSANYLTIQNCWIYYMEWGIVNYGIECHILFNKLNDITFGGIYIGAAAHDCLVEGNNVQDITRNSAFADYGILVNNGADRVRVLGNYVDSVTNAGAGVGYGIRIDGANCNDTVVVGNGAHNCKTANYSDAGTSTTATGNDTT